MTNLPRELLRIESRKSSLLKSLLLKEAPRSSALSEQRLEFSTFGGLK